MKKLSFFLMAMLVSLTSFAAALGEGYSKVTDITTLSAGDKVVLYCDDADKGVTGWDGNKTATAAEEGWVEYVVEAAEGGVLLKDGEQYIALTAKNGFYYTATGSVCKVTADGVLYITLSGADYLLYENANNGSPLYRMYVDKTGNAQYKPVYVYEVVVAEEGGESEGEGETATVPTNAELWEAFKPYYNTYYGLARADQPIDKVTTFAPAKMQEIMTDAKSDYKWLGDYVLNVAAGQGLNLPTDMAAANEGAWRWAVHAFFNATTGANGAAGTDFTEAGKPENWGPYYLAAQEGTTPEPEPEPTTETVYFVNAANWTTVNVYAWTTDPNASWPGVAATKEAEQIAGYDVYSYTVEAGTYANVIFNNGSGQQTADLVWTAGKYYVKDGWYTKEEAETKLAAPVEYESVYFVDNQGWGKANIYTWTPEVGTWPGVAMTKEAEQLAGYDVYSYTVEKGTSFGGVIFNNGSGVQTGDLKWTAGKYYVKDAWYTKEEAEAKLAGPVTPPVITYVLMGVAGDWTTGIALTVNPDNANEYVLLGQEIAEGDAVKVVTLTDGTATAWCGNVDEYSVAHTADDMGNIVLAPGKYDFYYKVAEDLIYIGGEAYPTEPEYEVMELTMTNLQVSNYGEATGLWASDTDKGIEVMLFLDAEGNLMAESSIMVSWMDYNVTGTVTKAYNEELATDVYTAELYTTVGETNYKLIITMYSAPVVATPVVVENAEIDDQTEETGFMYMTGVWTDAEGVVYPVKAEVPGFDITVAEAVYKNVTVTVGGMGDEDPWLGFVQGDATITVVENIVTLTGVMSSWDGLTLDVTITATIPTPVKPVEMVGVVKRAIQNGDEVIVLTLEANGTAHIYQVVDGKAVAELSQEGVVAVDPENAGDMLAISDIALTEDGKLVAINKIVCQAGDAQVDEGYKRGETKIYIWNDLAGAPSVWFTSKMASNWYRSVQGQTIAYKGTSTNGTLVTTGITATGNKFRYSVYNVIDGVYTDPAVNDSEYYHYTKGSAQTTDNIGANYEINISPLAENTWILDGELIDPFEITDPLTYNTEVTAGATVNEDFGKKYNGATYVTVGEQVWMVAPFATPAGDLVAVQVLDITNGLGAAQYVNMLYLEESVAATAAATAVQVTEEALVVTLVADATIYTMELPLSDEPDYQMYEDAITNLVIDYDNMLLIGGPSDAFQVEVVLGLGDYDRNTDNFALLPESSISVLGSEATFIDGIASVDGIAQTATAVVHCMWNGMALEFHLTMSAAPLEATVVVVENAAIEIEKYLLWGDMYDYSLKMTGVWTNEGIDYPVLVEVPVYYPEATEPYEMYSTVTVGGMGDEDPWLGFGEGYLTITQEGDKITAAGIVENPMAGIAIDITISGSTNNVPDGLDNVEVTVKSVKMIKNGQLIIKKGDVEYNVNGAILK